MSVTLNEPGAPMPEQLRPEPRPAATSWGEIDPAKNGWDIITDSRGRQLAVAELEALDRLDLAEACGELSSNQRYYFDALTACMVRGIDGEVLAMPRTNRQLRSHIKQVANAGTAAVLDWIGKKRDEAGENKDIGAAKN